MKKSLIILGVGVAFVVVGILTGELGIVLTKATRICLECIGIG